MQSQKEKIVLFGASRLGEIAFNVLKDKYNIVYFSDNDKSKWGSLFCNTKIISPVELIQYRNKKIIIASSYYDEISVQLKNMDLNNIYIFSYPDTNDTTYSKKYFIDKMCDLNIYKGLKTDEGFKNKFIDNFSLIYGNNGFKSSGIVSKDKNSKKNVLMIAYFFPPIGGSGVQRTLKFVRYLRGHGWNPIVLTVGNSYTPYDNDDTLLNELSQDTEIYRIDQKYINSEQLNYNTAQQILNLVYGLTDDEVLMKQYCDRIKENNCSQRRWILEPDKYIVWVNEVLQNIEKTIDFKKIDLIYTTSGPYSGHIVGYYIKRKYNIPWVADFRDEWFNNQCAKQFYKGDKFKRQLHKSMEQKIVDYADRVIAVTPVSSQNYRDIFNLPYEKVVTITNGYDEEDFEHISREKSRNDKFLLLFYGSLYFGNDYLDRVFMAVNELIKDKRIDKNLIEIKLIGKIDISIQDLFSQLDKYNLIKYEGYKPHLECICEGSKSNILLLPSGPDEGFIPVYLGKIFEYLRFAIPILAIVPKNSAMEQLLKETGSGKNFDHDDIRGIKSYILKYYNEWLRGENSFNPDFEKIKQFERQKLTEKLSKVFDELLSKNKLE